MSTEYTPITYGMTRASTSKQVASPAMQRDIIQRACVSLKLGTPVWLDEPLGTSARELKYAQRPMGLWTLHNLRRGDILVVTEIRTIGRNFIDAYSTVDFFFSRGIRVVILKGFGGQVIDLCKSTDRLFLAILAWAADEEAQRVSERTKEGLALRKKQGLASGCKKFHYIQTFNAQGEEIPRWEYNKVAGHYKKHMPDRQWLDQLLELLLLQKSGIQGECLYNYCKERNFTNRQGRKWWDGPVFYNRKGNAYRNRITETLRQVRRMAVAGELTEEYNQKVLAITGDTIIDVTPVKKSLIKGVRRLKQELAAKPPTPQTQRASHEN